MCNPTTHRPISEALPLVTALIAEAERNCIDLEDVNVHPLPNGRFSIYLTPYDGGGKAFVDLLGLRHDVVFTVDGKTFEGVVRTVGRWIIKSHIPLSAEAVAA
jgi:hypothetical protein|nr:MAG TPA: hypothetical protein [Caudoviricetes sp.]